MRFTAAMTASATAPTLATVNNFTWYDTAASPTESYPCVYCSIWEINYDGSLVQCLSVSLFNRYGKTGNAGSDAYSFQLSAPSVIIGQATTSPYSMLIDGTPTGNTATSIIVRKGNKACTVNITSLSTYHCNASRTYGGTTYSNIFWITAVLTDSNSNYYETGYVEVTFTVTDPDNSSNTFSTTLRFNFYCNLMGTWKTTIQGDIEQSVANKKYYTYDENGNVVSNQTIAEYIRSSSINSSRLENEVDGHTLSISEIQQTAEAISMGVSNGWKNYVTNPLSTDGTGGGSGAVSEDTTVNDSVFGTVRSISYYNEAEWQLRHTIGNNYSELTGKTVTWFCIVAANGTNCRLNFGSGYNTSYNSHAAIHMSGSFNSMTVTSALSDTYYENIKSGKTYVGVSGSLQWYLCWTTAKLKSGVSIIPDTNILGFNSMYGKWEIYYCGIVLGKGCPSLDVIISGANLKRTGIDIKNGLITLDAATTRATGDFYVPRVISENDDMMAKVESGHVEVRSKSTQSYGIFEINSLGEVILSMYDKDGNCVINIGGTPNTIVNGEWVTWKLCAKAAGHTSDGKTYYAVSDSDCTTYYQLKLGQIKNTDSTLQYFLPPSRNATQGQQTTDTDVIARNNKVFTNYTTSSPKATMESEIKSLTTIPDGYYVKPNDGRFEVEANIYGPTNYVLELYHFVGGVLAETIEQRFSL